MKTLTYVNIQFFHIFRAYYYLIIFLLVMPKHINRQKLYCDIKESTYLMMSMLLDIQIIQNNSCMGTSKVKSILGNMKIN